MLPAKSEMAFVCACSAAMSSACVGAGARAGGTGSPNNWRKYGSASGGIGERSSLETQPL